MFCGAVIPISRVMSDLTVHCVQSSTLRFCLFLVCIAALLAQNYVECEALASLRADELLIAVQLQLLNLVAVHLQCS
uniref:Hypothetical secreted protein 1709 n=1 Tax=Amblyomma variegatum TaxID=34610 RepID=F0J9X9_AMBVA|nr:TPA_inf: hypothetical secreted protein 1709 [Amblyomma variegatum]